MLSLKKKMLMAGGARLRPQDVFATSLYTGNGAARTITNGLDLAGKGGLVWIKRRSPASNHMLFDTARLARRALNSNSSSAEATLGDSYSLTDFTGSGFSLGNNPSDLSDSVNFSGTEYTAWSFREAKKFFVKLTYTGNGQSGRQIPHGLGDVPGMIVVKARDAARDWSVYHRSRGASKALLLNYTNAESSSVNYWNNTEPTSTAFTVGLQGDVNSTGVQYVAYLFAHNPELIDCGSYTGNGSANGPAVTCGKGWKPQFLIIKNVTQTGTVWYMFDSARGLGPGTTPFLQAQSSEAEVAATLLQSSNTGFQITATGPGVNAAGNNYVFMAIRSPT